MTLVHVVEKNTPVSHIEMEPGTFFELALSPPQLPTTFPERKFVHLLHVRNLHTGTDGTTMWLGHRGGRVLKIKRDPN